MHTRRMQVIRRITASERHLVYVALCRWPYGMQVNQHTIRSSTQSDINKVSHWYNNSRDEGQNGCPKHVENRNKHTWKIVPQVGYLQGWYQWFSLKFVDIFTLCKKSDRNGILHLFRLFIIILFIDFLCFYDTMVTLVTNAFIMFTGLSPLPVFVWFMWKAIRPQMCTKFDLTYYVSRLMKLDFLK